MSLFPPPSPDPSAPLLLFPSDKPLNLYASAERSGEVGGGGDGGGLRGGGGAAEREKRKNPQEQGTAWIGGKVGDKRATVTEGGLEGNQNLTPSKQKKIYKMKERR